MQYAIDLAHRGRALLCVIIALFFTCGLGLLAGTARAEVADYADVGAWSITYTQADSEHICSAFQQFSDKTAILISLAQTSSDIQWQIFLGNPAWTDAMRNRSTVILLLVTDSKTWRAEFNLSQDKKVLGLLNVSTDFIESIAATRSLTILDENRHSMTRALSMRDASDALKSVIQCLRDHPPPPPSSTPHEVLSTGTGFFVASGRLLTANHVVDECTGPIYVRYPNQPSYKAIISGQDETNDLALLSTEMSNLAVASFRPSPRLGDSVAAFGFPYAGILAAEGSFTLGNISSLSGIGNDTRFLQMSTPIQPGNSGGPLLDMSGNVVGVVVSSLNALAIMKASGSVPENVNFAIHGLLVTNFLSIKGVTPVIDTSGAAQNLSPSDVADVAKKFTVQIYCQGKSEEAH